MLFCKKIQGTYVYLLESFENLKNLVRLSILKKNWYVCEELKIIYLCKFLLIKSNFQVCFDEFSTMMCHKTATKLPD